MGMKVGEKHIPEEKKTSKKTECKSTKRVRKE